MKRDPMQHFERLTEQAHRESPPQVAVADVVIHTILAQPSMLPVDRWQASLRMQFWFATAAASVAVVTCWFAWPSWESPLENYALLWSPLAGTLP